ncbi:threonine aspartase 1-like isoform X2 [Xenia sp. Carnegie-2017]|nr:threonine aspartase 1-like isoform X2 [Xenia sp. Carnegie-2017]
MACQKACASLQLGQNALEALTVAIKVLENSPLTNAGIGSNLTMNGEVECDASIMDGSSSSFGAVAAVSGIKNPIVVSKKLLQLQSTSRSFGQVPPMILCGEGAHDWAIKHGILGISPKSMISEASMKAFRRYSSYLNNEGGTKMFKIDHEDECVMDTVGGVCLDSNGYICAGVSSGGILMKYPGRIGQAAIYGSGCWASNAIKNSPIACSSSGCGEELIKTSLCKECWQLCTTSKTDGVSILQELLKKKFIESPFLCENDDKQAGIILLKSRFNKEPEKQSLEIDFSWGHTTRSMAVGCMAVTDRMPQFFVSRLKKEKSGGSLIHTQSIVKQFSLA